MPWLPSGSGQHDQTQLNLYNGSAKLTGWWWLGGGIEKETIIQEGGGGGGWPVVRMKGVAIRTFWFLVLTKEDDVAKISTSIYVSNFPEVFSAKDLFHACKKYGHVIDSFIPFKKSKDGKRFGFVRFINVFNMERLSSTIALDGTLCLVDQDRLRPIIVDDLSK
ncbi:nucleotide-binding alpha-beta plait domain-containing protein [Tanacetum coccineum]